MLRRKQILTTRTLTTPLVINVCSNGKNYLTDLKLFLETNINNGFQLLFIA